MSLNTENILRAAILHIPGVGSGRLRQLLAFYGTAKNAWEDRGNSCLGLSENAWFQNFCQAREKIDPEKVALKLAQEGISLVALGEDRYPCLLAECPDAPPLLFYKGMLKASQEGIAIVGSRRATPYGKAAASYLAKNIAGEGYVIVSGLARGIDTAAHRGALEGNGVTWAFMAGGLDTVYPSENLQLAHAIQEKGGALISEYPPGRPVEPGHFPARNRLISGSARGVVVVEAAQKSGSLITVDFALEQGREVFAVPGPIFSEQSKGTHQLLKMGAKLASEPEDILSELPPKSCLNIVNSAVNVSQPKKLESTGQKDRRVKTGGKWQEILDCLSDVPLHIDRLTVMCPLSAQEIALGLLELQLSGQIIQLPGQYYVLERV
ncbi:MAG TPA: DNA-protecting protein DprA [Peptococcaceae bacterium]|nr:DNA-protecting protein DprA [Peptococcaceae bacterium]